MNEIYTVEDLAYRCSDFAEHVDKIIEQVNLGNLVQYSNTGIPLHSGGFIYDSHLNSNKVHTAIENDDCELANKLKSSLSIHTPLSRKFAQLIDEKTQELAEKAARSYKGKYDE